MPSFRSRWQRLIVFALLLTLPGSISAVTVLMPPSMAPPAIEQGKRAASHISHNIASLPLSFEPNAGQTDPSVRFLARVSYGTLYFTQSEIVLAMPLPNTGEEPVDTKYKYADIRVLEPEADSAIHAPQSSILRIRFLDASPTPKIESLAPLSGKVNYFLGNDPSRWHTNLPTYESISYRGLYPGVGLTYEGTAERLKGTYTAEPGAEPNRIRWRYDRAVKVWVDEKGDLKVIVAGPGNNKITLMEQAPVAWQEIGGKRVGVSVDYRVASDNSVNFRFGDYDPNYPLTIDPTLTYSTYLGGASQDEGRSIAVDTDGDIYVTGFTDSTDFPIANAIQPSFAGGRYDAFVTKLNAAGTALIYSTYLGGDNKGEEVDYGHAVAVDGAGNAYVAGITFSSSFPTANAFQPSLRGNADAFLTKLNPTGSALVYSTYLGGSGGEGGHALAVDGLGSAYLTGVTVGSADFPTQSPYQPTSAGLSDTFATKFSPDGSALTYSTYLGGNQLDYGQGIVVDVAGNAYLGGYTESPNFPITSSAYQTYRAGPSDVFITKFSASGTALAYSTYLGGSSWEGTLNGFGIAVDNGGNAYVASYTESPDFPLVNPFQPTRNGFDAFVTKLNASGSSLAYSTYLGGKTNHDYGFEIAVDGTGYAYVTGWTESSDFPTRYSLQPYRAPRDSFVIKFTPAGNDIVYSTYLGGWDNDIGYGIALDGAGNVYVTGWTDSASFPIAGNPFQPTSAGFRDLFISKLFDPLPASPTPVATTSSTATATPIPSYPPTSTHAATPAATHTVTSTTTPCLMPFTDVLPTDFHLD
jgi:hypothetical protein